jgi:hypothetical protein
MSDEKTEARMTKRILVVAVSFLLAGVALGNGPYGFGGTPTVTALSSMAFSPLQSSKTWDFVFGYQFRYFTSAGGDFGGSVSIPAGAMIDKIGLASCDAAGGNYSIAALVQSDNNTGANVIDAFSSSAHGAASPCSIDYSATELNFQKTSYAGLSIQIVVTQATPAPMDGSVSFGAVEVWWHTVVGVPPGAPSFADVPPSNPFYGFIEALAASGITGGCGGGNYCPNNPVTRGQMAVFLAKALGLDWPN